MKNLNVRIRIIKLVEENIGVNFCDFGLNIGFLDMTPSAQQQKKNKLDLIKM